MCGIKHHYVIYYTLLKQADSYNPRRLTVSNNCMEEWRTVLFAGNLNGNLIQIPGIGAETVAKLRYDVDKRKRITNTYQLVGLYLTLMGSAEDGQVMSVAETDERFWHWLQEKGIVEYRSVIVMVISEYASSLFPGLNNGSEVDGHEEGEADGIEEDEADGNEEGDVDGNEEFDADGSEEGKDDGNGEGEDDDDGSKSECTPDGSRYNCHIM
jgi:hypothetical protein